MDWSLVLFSQGIESVLEQTPEGWQLRVADQDFPRAQAILAQYETENRSCPRHASSALIGLGFDRVSLIWAAVVIAFYVGQQQWSIYTELGCMLGSAVLAGEWWRLCTAVWLHADTSHLVLNLTSGVPLLGLTMGAYGSGIGLLTALLAGVLGNAAALAVGGATHRSLGASGMILGALGMLTAHAYWWHRQIEADLRWAGAALAAGVMLFLMVGAGEGSDLIAHAGGWGAGLVLGGILLRCSSVMTLRRPGRLNLVAGLMAACFTVFAWLCAFRCHGG
ncbi:MAG: rhomboid family intramembrane serine protease [Verrucomicrobiota bacterium]|nr:rhomboid family intramembrane serine protease [Limisphaera sp.]MDW8380566.1 rhomboid family intramembrane serine protease [Verrucomicrobiota bacterium]